MPHPNLDQRHIETCSKYHHIEETENNNNQHECCEFKNFSLTTKTSLTSRVSIWPLTINKNTFSVWRAIRNDTHENLFTSSLQGDD